MCCPNLKKFGAKVVMRSLVQVFLPALVVIPALLATEVSAVAAVENSIASIEVQQQPTGTSVQVVTKDPVGYRYTVYDSFDPVRVVIDFPGMDVADVGKVIPVNEGPVQEVRVSSLELTSGRLGRIELLLTTAAKYEVDLEGNTFQIKFDKGAASEPANSSASAATPATEAVPALSNKASAMAVPPAPAPETVPAPAAEPISTPEPAMAAVTPAPSVEPPAGDEKIAQRLQSVQVATGQALLHNDGKVAKYQYFKLGSPPRLVVDLFNIHPQFKDRTLPVGNGFKTIRVGTYPDKTRLVFDATGSSLPQFTVVPQGNDLVVSWGGAEPLTATVPAPTTEVPGQPTATPAGAPAVEVESVTFDVKDGKSLVSVGLSGPAELIPVAGNGTTIGFGIKNATISRALRRTLDASAFPSAVKRVTPYTVLVGDGQDVRFAVELKGTTDYSLEKQDKMVVLAVTNHGFEQPAAPASEVLPVPVPVNETAAPVANGSVPAAPPSPVAEKKMAQVESGEMAAEPEMIAATPEKVAPKPVAGVIGAEPTANYSGQKITLVFDDADILNILQLIAEVSNLNIVASDDVKGTITLRLIDVPWDQALALIMDIKDLGMVKEGNIARIMPREKLQAMEEARMNAARTREKLEDLETQLITVNYADLGNVGKHVKEVLTKDRDGVSVSEDARNKQLIVRDIPSNLLKIKELVGKLDTPERQVMIEARIVEASSTFSRDLGIKWGFSSEAENRASQLGNNQFNLGMGGSFLISPPAAGSVLGGAGLGAGVTFGSITGTSLDLRISALEAAGHGKVISKPRISTLNGGEAKISQGTKIPYQSSGPDGPKTEFVDANLELKVTPVINPDNSMILDISATNSSVGVTVSTGTGGNAPSIDTREAKTKLLVRDGETTVIGGIFVESEIFSDAGVPWLMKVPLIGNLFKSNKIGPNTRSELLIFITPRIVN